MAVQVTRLVWKMPARIGSVNRFVLLCICDFYNVEKDMAWPSVRLIMERTELAERTVRGSIAFLSEAGLISIVRGGGNGKDTSRYRPNIELIGKGVTESPIDQDQGCIASNRGAPDAGRGACGAKPLEPLKGVTITEALSAASPFASSPPKSGGSQPPLRESRETGLLLRGKTDTALTVLTGEVIWPQQARLLPTFELLPDNDRSIVRTFPCCGRPTSQNQQKTWALTRTQYDEFKQAYPGIDVDLQLDRYSRWQLQDKANLRTHTGILKSIHKWLNGEQDKTHYRGQYNANSRPVYGARSADNTAIAEGLIQKRRQTGGNYQDGGLNRAFLGSGS